MTSTTRITADVRCRADPGCQRVVCFQIQLRTPSGTAADPPVDACADHFGGVVQDLARSARARGLRDGHLRVSVVTPDADQQVAGDPESPLACFPFASIALSIAAKS